MDGSTFHIPHNPYEKTGDTLKYIDAVRVLDAFEQKRYYKKIN